MTVRKAETVYLGDASSVVKAAQTAQKANADYAARVKASADEIIASQDKVAAAGKAAADAAVKSGASIADASARAGKAALDESKAVGDSTARQIASYRAAVAAAVSASAEQSAASAKAADSQVAAAGKGKAAAASFAAGVADAAKKVSEGLLAIGAGAVFADVKFQAAMEQIHTQAGASQAEVDKMSKSVLGLATVAEQGPVKLAQALYEVESVGLRGATALSVLRAASNLSAVGQSSLSSATSALASSMVAWQLKSAAAAKTAGILNAIVGAGKMHMQDLTDAMGTKLPGVAAQFGISLKSVGAALAVFTDQGVNAVSAATNLVTPLFKMAVVTAPKAKDALKSIGLGVNSLADDFRSGGILKAVDDLHTHLSDTFGDTASGHNKWVDTIANAFGGSRGSAPILQLLATFDSATNSIGVRQNEIAANTAKFTSEVAAEHQTASHKINVAWSTIQAAFVTAGKALTPTVAGIVSSIGGFITQMQNGQGAGGRFKDAIVQVFDELKPVAVGAFEAIKGVVSTTFGVIMAVVPPAVNVFKSVVNSLGGMRTVLPAVVAGFVAFKVVGTIVPILTGVYKAMELVKGVGLASAFMKLDNPLGLIAAGVGGLVGLFLSLSGGEDKEKIAAQEVTKAKRDEAAAIKTAAEATLASVDAQFNAINSAANLKTAQDAVTAARDKYGASSSQYRNALLQEHEASVQNIEAQDALAAANKATIASNQAAVNHAKHQLAAANQITGATDAQIAAANKLERAQALAAISQFQIQRLLAGGDTITANNAFQMQELIAQYNKMPKSVQTKLLVDPQEALVKINALTVDLRGVEKQKAIKILGDTSNAQDAIKKLTALVNSLPTAADTAGKSFTRSIGINTVQAYNIGSANFKNLAKNIASYIGSAANATGKGFQNITAQVNAQLKGFGEKGLTPVTVRALSPGALAAVITGQVSAGAAAEGGGSPDGGHATGGIERARPGGKIIQVAEGGYPEVILTTDPKHGKRQQGLLSQFLHAAPHVAKGMIPGFAAGGFPAMIAEANAINAKHYNYEWGGGHDAAFSPSHGTGHGSGPGIGYDCSGSVSAVLHAGGLLKMPEVASEFMSYGLPGPGAVSIFASPTHVFMSLDGKFFGTHGADGAGWYDGSPVPGFTVRHAPVASASVTAPKVSGTGGISTIVRSGLSRAAKAGNSKIAKAISAATAGGQIGGGDIGTFPGALVTASEFGGHNDASAFGLSTASGKIANDSLWGFAELSDPPGSLNFSALGGLPMGAKIKVGYKGKSITVPKVDVGAGGPAIPPAKTRAIDLTYAANAALGAPGLENVNWARAAQGAFVAPFVGAFKNGGVVPKTGMALVHQGETILSQQTGAMGPFLDKLGAALAGFTALLAKMQGKTAPTHDNEIAGLEKSLRALAEKRSVGLLHLSKGRTDALAGISSQEAALTRQENALPTAASGKKGDAQRLANRTALKNIEAQRLTLEKQRKAIEGKGEGARNAIELQYTQQRYAIEKKINALRADDKTAKQNLEHEIKALTVGQQQLQQLSDYKAAIASLKSQVTDLASQAAQAWNTLQTTKINATHDAAVAAINNSPAAQQLAALQAQDAADQNAQQLASLNSAISTDQFTIAHSAGQTQVDAQAQLVQDQDALTAYQRQQDEARLQDQITTATNAADATQTTALNGLDQQTADYQAALEDQMGVLTSELAKRKISYATWAKDVNAILAQYGLSVSTDSGTEVTVQTGPGPAAQSKTGSNAPKVVKVSKQPTSHVKQHRAGGGDVQPGYVYTVGEEGPEDVVFGQKGTVMTAAQTRQRSGRSGPLVNIEHFHAHSTRAAKAAVDRLAYRAAIGTA
jgi:hypothetical protein